MTDNQTSDQIFASILNAYLEEDGRTFEQLCQRHTALVLESFAGWTQVPEPLRESEPATQAYIGAVVTVAQYMKQLGYDGPINCLTGAGDGSIDQWYQMFSAAQNRANDGNYEESNEILTACLRELGEAQGNVIDDLQPKILGMLGSNCMHLGDFTKARDHTQAALAACERLGDRDGIRAYRENLDILRAIVARQDYNDNDRAFLNLRARIARAQDLSDRGLFTASDAILKGVLPQLEAATHEHLGPYRAKALGLLGSNAYKSEAMERAHKFTYAALEICTDIGDFDGIRIYQSNLESISQKDGPKTAR